jgi:hypothetical protein
MHRFQCMRNLCLNQFFRNGNHFQEAFRTKKLVSSQHVRHSGDREGSLTFNQRAQNLPANWASRRAGPSSEPTNWHWGDLEERLTSLVNDRISSPRKDTCGMDFERKPATANQFSRRLPLRQSLTELPGLRVDPSISDPSISFGSCDWSRRCLQSATLYTGKRRDSVFLCKLFLHFP